MTPPKYTSCDLINNARQSFKSHVKILTNPPNFLTISKSKSYKRRDPLQKRSKPVHIKIIHIHTTTISTIFVDYLRRLAVCFCSCFNLLGGILSNGYCFPGKTMCWHRRQIWPSSAYDLYEPQALLHWSQLNMP